MPLARKYGRITRLPPSAAAEYAGPVSYSSRKLGVSINKAFPCPMSNAVTQNPRLGALGSAIIKGNQANSPAQRKGQPRGVSNHSVPAIAKRVSNKPGLGACHTASGSAASHSSPCDSSARVACASCNTQAQSGAGNTTPKSASGVTTALITGMATALASGLISDTCANSNRVSGNKPAVTAICV